MIYKEKIQIMTPRNCQTVKLKLISNKNAKILGSLAKDVFTETMLLKNQALKDSYSNIPKALEGAKPQEDQEMQ